MPDRRTSLADFYSPDPTDTNRFYQNRVGVIDGFVFDWASYRIPQATYAITDIAQWLALDVARRAIEDAGYSKTNVPRDRTGVLIGNTITGEQMRHLNVRLNWPFVRRTLRAAVESAKLPSLVRDDIEARMEDYFRSTFAPITEDLIAGNISATIAGRVCNYFDFHGGAYTIDGACGSSLLAVSNACNLLESRDLDVAIAGGVDISLDAFELLGFARAGALSQTEIRPYDRRAAGFIPGEGAGFVTLKRLEDARAAGDYVYAVIRGWGISADGKSGIMQPSRSGQAAAVKRAYDRAGYGMKTLHFVEGHGTGTRLGDKTELEAIGSAMEAEGGIPEKSVGIGSVKSIIGHTKAAAGIAALIKTAAAVNRRVIPGTASIEQPATAFETTSKSLYPLQQGGVADPTATLRAGVSAFGFGGINAHITLESGDAPAAKLAPPVSERALLVSHQETEVFPLGADSAQELLERLPSLREDARRSSIGELTDLAAQLASELPAAPRLRAVVIAGTPEILVQKLTQLEAALLSGQITDGRPWTTPERDIWIGRGNKAPRVAFLFPGQGSQQLQMARVLVERFEWAQTLLRDADRWVVEAGGKAISPLIYRPLERVQGPEQLESWERELAKTEVAQPAICFASILHARHLAKLGILPTAVGGHSLGELTAFHEAGALDAERLIKLATLRGLAMAASPKAGTMLSLSCSLEEAQALLARAQVGSSVVMANINSPRQVVISGDEAAVEHVAKTATTEGLSIRRLPVSNAFHSPLVAEAARRFAETAPLPKQLGALNVKVLSSVGGTRAPATVAPGMDLAQHFTNQIVAQVDFVTLARRMATEADVMLEVGPGKVLSSLVRDTLGADGPICFPVASKAGIDLDLNVALAALFAQGAQLRWSNLYEARLVNRYEPASRKVFIENPIEQPLRESERTRQPPVLAPMEGALEGELVRATGLESQVLTTYLASRTRFLAEVVKADLASAGHSVAQSAGALPAARAVSPTAHTGATALASSQVPVAAVSAGSSLEALVLGEVARRTGYPVDGISTKARLLDDLNLDSIKAGELVAAVAKAVGAAGKIEPSRFANATIAEVVQALQPFAQALTSGVAPSAAAVAAPPPPQSAAVSLEQLVRAEVSRRTGYPVEGISLQARLLDDLNLDSIKAGELVAAVAKAVGAAGKVEPSRFANSTLAEIAAALAPFATATISAPTAPSPAPLAPMTTPAAGAVVSASVAPVASGDDLESLFRDLVAHRTGYPRDSFALSARLLDDLNLDSIKAGELVGAFAQAAGVGGRLEPSKYSNASLADVCTAVRDAGGRGNRRAGSTSQVTPVPVSTEPVSREYTTLIEQAQRLTGYGRDVLRPEAHLVEELRLDEGKIRQLVERTAEALGIAQRVDLAPLQNRTLRQLGSVFETLANRQPKLPAVPESAPSRRETWVRNYAVEFVPHLRHGHEKRHLRTEDDWVQARVLLVSGGDEDDHVEALAARLTQFGAVVEHSRFEDARKSGIAQNPRYSHLIAILPRTPNRALSHRERLAAMYERLLSVAAAAPAEQGPRRRATVAYVQYGGGYFGTSEQVSDPETCCTTGFARSLHLERADLRVRTVDLSPAIDPARAAQVVVEELTTPDAFSAVGFDAELVRRVPRLTLQHREQYKRRDIAWKPGDVILVTGGGRGVTAECALAMAKATGASLALVGRTRPPAGPTGGPQELARTLERLNAEGVRHRYYACDVADPKAVQELVARVRAELGPIEGVIHGAMVLKGCKAENLTVQGGVSEVSPKVLGALNLCEALADAPPKMLIGLTSIVSHQGMPWSSSYAFSNEALDLIFRRFAAEHPRTVAQSIGYGVWGEVGEAARLNTTKHLQSVGLYVGEISPQEGLARFAEIVTHDPGTAQVVVTTWSQGYDTWTQLREPQAPRTSHRFLEQVEELEPGVELVARTRLSLTRDTYLNNYNFKGMYLLPAVFQQEAAAQAATWLVSATPDRVAAIEDVSFPWPITIDPAEGRMIEIRALASERTSAGEIRVRVKITSEQSNYEKSCFEATIILRARVALPKETIPLGPPLPIDAPSYLEATRLFFGSLMTMGPIYSTDPQSSVWASEAREEAALGQLGFAPGQGGVMVLGDPYFREVLIQTALLSAPKTVPTPKHIDRVEFYALAGPIHGLRICRGSMRQEGDEVRADILAVDAQGRPVERLSGFTFHLHKERARAASGVRPVPAASLPPAPAPKAAVSAAADEHIWARNFSMDRVSQKLTSSGPVDWSSAKVLLITDAAAEPLPRALAEALSKRGAQIQTVSETDAVAQIRSGNWSHAMVLFPAKAAGTGTPKDRVRRALARVLAPVGIGTDRPRGRAVVYVQHGGGAFGAGAEPSDLETCASTAFARSLHLEFPDLKVRVVDLADGLEPVHASGLVLEELGTPEAFVAAAYNEDGLRSVPRLTLQNPGTYTPRRISWSTQDVVLVTGGGKGVTAECALALARETGVTLALVGRTPGSDAEVRATLARFDAAGCRHRYYACDVTDGAAVATLVQRVARELGAVTGLIHGAMVAHVGRVDQVTVDSALTEVSPKVVGAMHLLEALEGQPLKLVVGLSSIALHQGMPGTAAYAYSNEALDVVLRAYAAAHRNTAVQIMAFGIWGEVGASVRADSSRKLERIGLRVDAISVEEGVRRFLHLFRNDPGARHVFVSTRTEGFDTWTQSRPVLGPPNGLRFIERVLRVEPEIELVARARLNIDRDTYLRDHVYRGMYIVPTVLAIEAISQAAVYVTGDKATVSRIEDLRMPWPIVVDGQNGEEIEIVARVEEVSPRGESRVQVTIRAEKADFKQDFVAATVVVGARASAAPDPVKLDKPLPIDPLVDLYGPYFFVGPMYQRMRELHSVSEERGISVAQIEALRSVAAQAFGGGDYRLVAGDPFYRDTLLHSSFLHDIRHSHSFTLRIGRLELFGAPRSDAEKVICTAEVKSKSERGFVVELVSRDAQGEVRERVSDYEFRILERLPGPSSEELVASRRGKSPEKSDDENRLLQLAAAVVGPQRRLSLALATAPKLKHQERERRHAEQLPLAQRALAALGDEPSDVVLEWSESGKPTLRGSELEVSFSMDDPYCLCVVGSGSQGCDLAAVTTRSEADWLALLGDVRAPLLRSLQAKDGSLDRAGTRIWSALEAVRKASLLADQALEVVDVAGEQVTFEATHAQGRHRIATFPVQLSDGPQRVVALVVAQEEAGTGVVATEGPRSPNDLYAMSTVAYPERGCTVVEYRFQPDWRECATPSRQVSPNNYVIWFKRMCDMMLGQDLGRDFVNDVLEGRIAGVARWTDLRVEAAAYAYDSIVARAWISQMSPAALEWCGEFVQQRPNGRTRRLAFIASEGTPVRPRDGRGFSVEPLPRKYLSAYAPFVAGRALSNGDSNREWSPGHVVSNATPGPRVLGRELFRTTFGDADVIGNVNNTHFFRWQAETRDLIFFAAAGGGGELASLHAHVDYLREVRPFDLVEVTLWAGEVRERGATLHADYHRLLPGGGSEKVAVGRQDVVWLERQLDGSFAPAAWPQPLRDLLLEGTGNSADGESSEEAKLLSLHNRGRRGR